MTAELIRVWINEFEGRRELRLDWSNDRHHALEIPSGCDADELAHLLHDFAELVRTDEQLGAAVPYVRVPASKITYGDCYRFGLSIKEVRAMIEADEAKAKQESTKP